MIRVGEPIEISDEVSASRKFLKNKNGKNLRDGNICFTFAVSKLLTIKKTA